MIEEFDNEIDSILRQTARGNSVFAPTFPQSNHLDADELSAFAENALPEKVRLNYIAHLADCDRCRKILSNLILLNSEIQSEIIHAEEPKLLAAAAKIPWYRKFFTVPTLALTMGAFIIFFAGIGIFSILQGDSMSSQVSQVSEKQPGGKGMSSDGEAAPQESFSGTVSNQAVSNANAMSANTTANTASNAANSSAPVLTAANSNSARSRLEPEQNTIEDDNRKDENLSADSKSKEDKESAVSATPPPAQQPPPPPPAMARVAETENKSQPTLQIDGSENTQDSSKSRVLRAAPKPVQPAAPKKKESSTETTTVSGKTFKRANNVWIDSAYRGQATTNVSRGTSEYKNLDAGLRGIVENLGGTVVVVWKEKAYRIQ